MFYKHLLCLLVIVVCLFHSEVQTHVNIHGHSQDIHSSMFIELANIISKNVKSGMFTHGHQQ